jgi:DNA recombination-mediator protein A
LRLIRSDNVGPRTFRTLLNHCGGARAALAALPDLARRGGASRQARICTREDAEREMQAAHAIGVRFVALGEAEYPARLQSIHDAPPLLAVRGHIDVLASPMVAVVGERNASAVGAKFAERLARALSSPRGWRAVSMPPRIARASPPAPLPCSPAGKTRSNRPSMQACSSRSCRRARRFPKCRSAGSRGHGISRAATA